LIAAAILSAVGLVVWLVGGSGDDGHQGPPPPVRLEIDEIKVSEEVTYPAVRDNRGDRIVPPAPEGFQLSSSEGFVRFSSAALIPKPGAWEPIAGVLLIVSCKVAVDDPNPRLEEINLVRGNEKVASLDGLAQPDFTKATARDLSSQFAEARKKGSRPYVSLLFRIPIESVIYTEKLAIEVCWKDRSGKSFSNKVTLDDALRPAPVPKALGQIRVENDSDKKRAMWKAVVNNSSGKAVAEYLLKDHLALVRSLNKDDAKIPISEGNEYLRGKVVVLRGDRKGISERLLELMPAGDLATTPQEVGCILVFEEEEWDISNYYRSQSRQDDRSSAFSPGAVFQTTWITSMYNINTCKCEWRHVCSSGMPEEVRVGSISYATPAPEEGYRSFLARLVRKGR